MAMTRATLCVTSSILVTIVAVCAWGVKPSEPGMSIGAKPSASAPLSSGHYVDESKTVYWNTTVVQKAHEGDSVWYRLSLVNHANPGLRFAPETLSPLFHVQVKAADGKTNKYTVDLEKVTTLSFVLSGRARF